jgi:hypothetical protein
MKWLLAVAVVIGTICVDEPRPKLVLPPGPLIKVVKRLEPMPKPKLKQEPMPKPKLKQEPMPKPKLKKRTLDLSNDTETYLCDQRDDRLVNCRKSP